MVKNKWIVRTKENPLNWVNSLKKIRYFWVIVAEFLCGVAIS